MEGQGFKPSNPRPWNGTNSSVGLQPGHASDQYQTSRPKHFPANAGRPKLVLPSVLPRASRLHRADHSVLDTRPKRDVGDEEMTFNQARVALDRLLGRTPPPMSQAAHSISASHNAHSTQADEAMRPEYIEYYASSLMQIRHSSYLCASGLKTTPLDETLNEVSKSTKFTVPSALEATIMESIPSNIVVSSPASTTIVVPTGPHPQPTCSAPLISKCPSDRIPDSSETTSVQEEIRDVRHYAAKVRASMGKPAPSRLPSTARTTPSAKRRSHSGHTTYSKGILAANAIPQRSGVTRESFSDQPIGSGINLPFIIAISNALRRVNASPQKQIDLSVSPSSILDMLDRSSQLPIQRVEARAGPFRSPG